MIKTLAVRHKHKLCLFINNKNPFPNIIFLMLKNINANVGEIQMYHYL